MNLECKICGNPTECSEDAVKITCSHCIVEMATYFVNRKAGLFYEIKEPTDWEARVSSSIELEELKKVEKNEKKA